MLVLVCVASTLTPLGAQEKATVKKILEQAYNLVPKHSNDTQYFEMESKLQKHALDGTIQGRDVYRLYLRCVPAIHPTRKDKYTCLGFTVQVNNSTAVSIPSLRNWQYFFTLDQGKEDSAREYNFGIDPAQFEHLKGADGKSLPVENTYHVYNAFIDFHTMSVFAERTKKDSGAQHLKQVGDKIVHEASYSQPPVSMGARVLKGSYFKNGKITLEFKGLGAINWKTCAIIAYDSGESSFNMLTKPMENMEVNTRGSSHYWGDIFKDLTGGWIQKAILHELVVSETVVPGLSNKIHSVIERTIQIKNVPRSAIPLLD
jgi:hypothetical protein